jgi:hypothetical protein
MLQVTGKKNAANTEGLRRPKPVMVLNSVLLSKERKAATTRPTARSSLPPAILPYFGGCRYREPFLIRISRTPKTPVIPPVPHILKKNLRDLVVGPQVIPASAGPGAIERWSFS